MPNWNNPQLAANAWRDGDVPYTSALFLHDSVETIVNSEHCNTSNMARIWDLKCCFPSNRGWKTAGSSTCAPHLLIIMWGVVINASNKVIEPSAYREGIAHRQSHPHIFISKSVWCQTRKWMTSLSCPFTQESSTLRQKQAHPWSRVYDG